MREYRVKRVMLLVAMVGALVAGTVQAAVWSLDTAALDLQGLERLKREPGVVDWMELGDRLLVAGEAGLSQRWQERGLPASEVRGMSDLEGTVLVLSKHSGVERILAKRTRVIAHEGPFFVIRPSGPALNRLLQEADHQLQFVRAGRRTVVFRSPAHLARVTPASAALAPIAGAVDKSRYTETLRKLIAFKTRYTYSQAIQQAAAWAVDAFKAAGCEAKVIPYTSRGKQLPNVVAELRGSARPDEIYVVGAHLDSISWDSQNSAPGADDNASGSAGVIEMARALSGRKPQATIRFVLFSGEEQGLLGSIALVNQMKSAGELARVKAMINLDMIAFDPTAPLDVMLEGKVISHVLSDRLQAAAQAYAPALKVYRTDNAWGSDHVSFLDAGVPSTLTIEYEYDGNGNEHSPKDVFEICNIDLAVAILRMDVAALAELAGVATAFPTSGARRRSASP